MPWAVPSKNDVDESRGHVITVFSPKGGTGKTVVSTNLASYLATRTDKRVLLVDLDLQFGDAAIMLGIEAERTMHELVARSRRSRRREAERRT